MNFLPRAEITEIKCNNPTKIINRHELHERHKIETNKSK